MSNLLGCQLVSGLGSWKTRRLSGRWYPLSMIIAVAGQKGGAGKTTLAISLAVEFHRQGRRVLLVDADPQGSSLTWGQVAVEMGHPSPAVVAMGPGLHRQDQLPAMAERAFSRLMKFHRAPPSRPAPGYGSRLPAYGH